MTSGSVLVKVLVIYLCLNILLFAAGYRLSDSTIFSDLVSSNNANASFLDAGTTYQPGTITSKTANIDSTSQGTISFIDALRVVADFIGFIGFLLVGFPVIFLTIFPAAIQLFIGVPLAVLSLIGIIYFARSGQ